MPDVIKTLTTAIVALLRPIVRMLQRNGVPYSVFAELAKRVYVDVASEQFAIPGRKQSVSRVSILTGLTRKEVMRIRCLAPTDEAPALAQYNRAARVIAGWVRDPLFTDGGDDPLPLDLAAGEGSFPELVRRHSGDMPVRAMLDELVRVGAVSQANGRVQLLARAYVPRTGESDKLAILGTDAADLINTIDHNIYACTEGPRFQRKVAYDNLPEEHTRELRVESAARAQKLIEELDRLFANADRDANSVARGTGRKRAGVGIYYFEENYRNG